MLKQILLIIICLQSFLFAHCDGCGNHEHESGNMLVGNVKYEGKIPKPRLLKMDADPVCGAAHENRVLSESFIVDTDMNLKNVLVWLKDVKYDGPPSTETAILDQQGCVYHPHVLGVQKGQKVLIKNSDATLHNIHSMAKVNDQFNFAMPKVVKEKETVFNNVEEPFYIKCDVHPWMKSWVLVQDHPYYAVTDSEGNFKIENIPEGTYTVQFWQERLSRLNAEDYIIESNTIEVKIVDDKVSNIDFAFNKPKKHPKN